MRCQDCDCKLNKKDMEKAGYAWLYLEPGTCEWCWEKMVRSCSKEGSVKFTLERLRGFQQ